MYKFSNVTKTMVHQAKANVKVTAQAHKLAKAQEHTKSSLRQLRRKARRAQARYYKFATIHPEFTTKAKVIKTQATVTES